MKSLVALCLLALAACVESPPPRAAQPPGAGGPPAASPVAPGAAPGSGPAAPGSPEGEDSLSFVPGESADPPATEQATAPAGGQAATTPVAGVPAPTKPKPNCGCQPGDLLCLMKCSDGKNQGNAGNQNPPPSEPDRSFDRQAALTTLAAAAKVARKCGTPEGPHGAGRVLVTFATTGLAVSSVVEAPPFGGTPVGACVARSFRQARVPSFTGGVIRVSKSFMIE